jgi:hypothetical protein
MIGKLRIGMHPSNGIPVSVLNNLVAINQVRLIAAFRPGHIFIPSYYP